MNGQPTAQNTRETGADGDLPGMRNWDNPAHIRELAELWNVDQMVIPHWAPPTHAMQIWRYAEQSSIELLCLSNESSGAVTASSSRSLVDQLDTFAVKHAWSARLRQPLVALADADARVLRQRLRDVAPGRGLEAALESYRWPAVESASLA